MQATVGRQSLSQQLQTEEHNESYNKPTNHTCRDSMNRSYGKYHIYLQDVHREGSQKQQAAVLPSPSEKEPTATRPNQNLNRLQQPC